jgi:hypothetical protein
MTTHDRLPDAVVQAILDVTDRHDGYSLLTRLIEELLEDGVCPRRVMCDFVYREMMGINY